MPACMGERRTFQSRGKKVKADLAVIRVRMREDAVERADPTFQERRPPWALSWELVLRSATTFGAN